MPKMYKVKQGQEGVLITKHSDNNVTQKPFESRGDLYFTNVNLRISPELITRQSYDPRSLAFQLARMGYMIFVDSGNPDKYALAVPARDVEQIYTEGDTVNVIN